MRKRWKKAISLILSLAMVFTMAGTSLAANTKADQSVSIAAAELNTASRSMKYKTVPVTEEPEFIYTPSQKEAYVRREEKKVPDKKAGGPAILKDGEDVPEVKLAESADFEVGVSYPTSDKEGKNVRFFEVTNAYTDTNGSALAGSEGALDPKYPFFFKADLLKKEGSTENESYVFKYLRLTINNITKVVAPVNLFDTGDYDEITIDDLNRIDTWYEESVDGYNVGFDQVYSEEPFSFGVKPGKVKVKAEIIDEGEVIDQDENGDPLDEAYIAREVYYSEEFEMTIAPDTEEELKPYVQGGTNNHVTFNAKDDMVEVSVAIPSYEFKGEEDAYLLITKGDEIVGTSLKGFRTTAGNDNDDRYGTEWDGFVTRPKMVLSGFVELYKYISEGSYNVVAGINGDEYVVENGATAYDGTEPRITGQSVIINTFVDETNNYVFVKVNGDNFDPTKITPVICSSENKALTKEKPAAVTRVRGGAYVYKLEKADGASFDDYYFAYDENGNLLKAEEGEPNSIYGYFPVKYVGASAENAQLPEIREYSKQHLPFGNDVIEEQGYCGVFGPDELQQQESTFITTPVYNYKEKGKGTAEFGLQNSLETRVPSKFLEKGDKIHIAISRNEINLLSDGAAVTGFDKEGLAASGTIPFEKGGSISIPLDGSLEYGRYYYWAVFAEMKGDEGSADEWRLLGASTEEFNPDLWNIFNPRIYNDYDPISDSYYFYIEDHDSEHITWYNYDGPGPVDPDPGPSPDPEPEEPVYEFEVISDNSILVYPKEETELNLEIIAEYGGLFTEKTELVPVLKNEYGRYIEMGPALKFEKYKFSSDDEEEDIKYGRFYSDWTLSEPLHDVGAIEVELYIKDLLPGNKDLNAAKRMDVDSFYQIGHLGGGMYVVDDGFYVRGNIHDEAIRMTTDFDGTVYFQLREVNYLGHEELIGAAAKDLWDELGYELEISGYNRFDEGEEFKPLTDWSIRGYRYDPGDGFTLMIDGLPDATVVPGLFAKFTKFGQEPVYIQRRNADYSFVQYYPDLGNFPGHDGIGPVAGVGEFFSHSDSSITMHSMDKDEPHAYYGVTVAEKDMATVTMVARNRVTLDEEKSFTVDKFETDHGLVRLLGSSYSDPSGTCYFKKSDFFSGWKEEGIYRLSAICTYDEYGDYSWLGYDNDNGAPASGGWYLLNRYNEYDCIGYLGEADDDRLWEEEPWVCTVYFETGRGASKIYPENVDKGEKALCPPDPVREGWEFDGWYEVPNPIETTAKFNFDTPIERDYVLYAGWKIDLGSDDPLAEVLDTPEHWTSGEGRTLSRFSPRYIATDVTKLSTFIAGMKMDISLKFAGVSRNELCSYRFTISEKKAAKINKDGVIVPKKRTVDGTDVTVNLEEKAKGQKWTTISSCKIFIQVPTVEKKQDLPLDSVSSNATDLIKDTTYRPTAFVSSNPAVLEIDKVTGAMIPKKKGTVKVFYIYGGQTTKDKASTKKRYKTTIRVGGK